MPLACPRFHWQAEGIAATYTEKTAIAEASFGNFMQQVTLQVHGLDCAEEVSLLRAQLEPHPGVKELSFDILRGRMTVAFDALVTSVPALVDSVEKTGLRAVECTDDSTPAPRGDLPDRRRRIALTTASGIMIFAGLIVQTCLAGWRETIGTRDLATPFAARGLFLVATVCGLWLVLPKVRSALLRMRPDMNLLMTIAVIGALSIGQDSEAATVSFLFSLSLTLESWSVDRARRAVESLMALAPDTACRLNRDGHEESVPATEVAIGSKILVRPGDRFPLDGQIVKGETTVNQAPITGESVPVPKSPGDPVFSGTINEDGTVEVVTGKIASDSMLARILRLVTDAQRKRSASEQWVETFARYYTPSVMILALAVIVVPPLVLNGAWSHWFYQGLVLLVIACPCALVISTPVSIVAALTSAARQGVLVKGGRFLELAAGLQAIAFDKTGTLTMGRPEVREVIPLSGHTGNELLEIASAIESQSRHPLAEAIVRHATALGIRPAPATDFQALSGKGATAMLLGRSVWIGSYRNLAERGQETPELRARFNSLAEQESSVVVVGNDEHVCGLIALGDAIRSNAATTLAALRQIGIGRIVMLTGDNAATARAVASATGVDDLRAELLPEDKVNVIAELVQQHGIVAMIGDGVNDAPAMARATFGIAMGHVGTDTALETADIVLINDDLSRIPWLIGHARRMLQIIRQNITASLAVKAGFACLTISGYASLWAAIAADTGVSLVVVMNALRLLTAAHTGERGVSAP